MPASNDLFEAGFYGAHHGLHAKRNHRMQKAFEVCTWIGGSYTPENQRLEPKNWWFVKGSLDEKLPIYEQDPKSKRLDSFEKRFVRD